MKTIKSLFLLSLILSCAAYAGGVDGGGGIGVRCNGNLELLDLHEARMRGLQFDLAPVSEEDAIKLTAELIAKHYWNRDTIPLDEHIQGLADMLIGPIFKGEPWTDPSNSQTNQVHFGPPLTLSDDIGIYHTMPGCDLVQVAYFSDSENTLKISQSEWDRMSWLERAALVAHELIYFMDRRESLENFGLPDGRMTSERARRFVGDLFSETSLTPKIDSVPEMGYLKCSAVAESEDNAFSYFYAFNSPTGLSAVFNVMYGRSSAYQTKASFQGINISDLANDNLESIESDALLVFSDEANTPTIELRIYRSSGAALHFQAYVYQSGRPVPMGEPQKVNCSSAR